MFLIKNLFNTYYINFTSVPSVRPTSDVRRPSGRQQVCHKSVRLGPDQAGPVGHSIPSSSSIPSSFSSYFWISSASTADMAFFLLVLLISDLIYSDSAGSRTASYWPWSFCLRSPSSNIFWTSLVYSSRTAFYRFNSSSSACIWSHSAIFS